MKNFNQNEVKLENVQFSVSSTRSVRKIGKKTSFLSILFAVIFMVLGGLLVGTYSAFNSKATSTGNLTFAINGHSGTFNITNGQVLTYDTSSDTITTFTN